MIARCLLLAVLLSGAPAAWACSCAPKGGPGAEMKDAQAVFFGRPVAPQDPAQVPKAMFFGEDLTYSFPEPWVLKGKEGPLSVVTNSFTSACGRPLKPGRLYLVYAEEIDGELRISGCGRTRPWFLAASDALYLITRISLRDWQLFLGVVVLFSVTVARFKRRSMRS